MKKVLFITLSLVAMLLGSCKSSNNVVSSSTDIQGEWSIEVAMDKSTQGGDQPATIIFGKDGRINGCATVNSFFGDYAIKNGKLSFSTVGMTRMMGQSMDIERAICDALDMTNTVKVDGATATVYDKSGKVVMLLKKK